MPGLSDTGKPVVLPRAPIKVGAPPAPKPSAATGLPGGARTYAGAKAVAQAVKTAPSQLPGAGRSPGNVAAASQVLHQQVAHAQAVKAVFAHQDPVRQAAIVKGVMAGRADPYTARAVKEAVAKMGNRALLMDPYLPASASGANFAHMLSSAIDKGLGSAASAIGSHALPESLGSPTASSIQQAGVGGKGASMLARLPVDLTRAAVEDPAAVPKTVQGLGSAAVGAVAGLAELPVKAVQEGPGKAFMGLYHGMLSDYSRRYGSLYEGNDRAFINRIKQQGAGPEALDILGLAGGLDATAGRAAADVAAAKEGVLGREAGSSFLTRARPALRVAGGDVRPQRVAPGALRITGQRAEDALRRVKEAKRPGEIPAREGEVRPLFGNRSQRVLSSFIASKYRRLMSESLNREVRGGAQTKLARMSSWERRAAPVVQEGFIPLDRGAQAAKDAIDARIASIVKERADNPGSPGNHIPPEFRDRIDELPNLQALHDNVGKWLTPRLAAFVNGEGERMARLEKAMPDSYLRAPVAEARRLRTQGEMLGIEHPDVINERLAGAREVAERGSPRAAMKFGAELNRTRKTSAAEADAAKFENYSHARLGLLQDYSARVRPAAQAKGWPEPSFIPHRDVPEEKLGNYTPGSGHRAMPAPKQTSFALWKGGAVDRNPAVYLSGLARSIKVGHQWPLVDEQLRRGSFAEPSAAAIKAAGFGRRRADTLTGPQYTKAMMFDGHEAKNLRLYNPGRLRESTLEDRGLPTPFSSRAGGAPPELEANALLHDLLAKNSYDVSSADRTGMPDGLKADDPFVKSVGWKALPPTAFDEIHASLKPSGLGGRLVGKAQGVMAAAILGASPSFLVMNTLAHMILAGFGTRGRILSDAVKFPLWWHGLTDEERNIVRAHAGGRATRTSERLGSTTPAGLKAGWENLKESGIGRFTVGNVASHANPFKLLFRAEDMQSNFFRNMVYYSATKRAALDSMAKDLSLGANAMSRLNHAFSVGPKRQMIEQLQNMHTAEELGRYTVNMMGDYGRFTSFERRFLNNRAVLFYSFLRHAARTLFYELPLHHPIATALVGEISKLHNDEVKKLLGGANLPYADSRLFFDKNGHLTSIDFARSSPVGSVSADIPNEGLAGAAQMIPPEVQPLLDMLYKQTPSGSPYVPNAFSLLNNFLSLSYPARLGEDLHFGTHLQQSDSIPFLHERPLTHKSSTGIAYQQQKQAAMGPNSQRVLASLFGLYPKPDDTQVVAQHRLATAGGGGSGARGGAWGGGSSSGGWGGSSSSASGGWG